MLLSKEMTIGGSERVRKPRFGWENQTSGEVDGGAGPGTIAG